MLDLHASADRGIHDLSHSSEPTGSAPSFELVATAPSPVEVVRTLLPTTDDSDAAVFTAAAEVIRLSAINDEVWGDDANCLPEDSAGWISWKEQADAASDAFRDAIERLISLPVRSMAGLSAIGATFPALSSFRDFASPMQPELQLIEKMMGDAQRLGTESQLIRFGASNPTLMDLVRRTREALDESDAANRVQDAIFEAHPERPLPPAALFYKLPDLTTLGFRGEKFNDTQIECFSDFVGHWWYGSAKSIAYLRTDGWASCAQVDGTPCNPGRPFDHAKATRIAEILKAKEIWDADYEAWRERTGIAAASDGWGNAIAKLQALWPQFATHSSKSITDILARASLVYDNREDLQETRDSLTVDVSGSEIIERSIVLDLAELAFDLGVTSTWSAPAAVDTTAARPTPDRRAMESYRTWLQNEYTSLTHEMYPNQPEMLRMQSVNNAGDRFHFRGEPPASSRAERILDMFALDWRADDSLFADRLGEKAA